MMLRRFIKSLLVIVTKTINYFSALNFGAIGSLIGHEITHAFDIQGRQYDGFGRLRDWWDPVTAGMFNETTQCMKDQYDHYKIDNMTVSSPS